MFAPLTAVSPDSSLLAVHINSNASSSTSDDDTKRVMIKCYDASVSLSSLKFTLSAKISARLDVLKFLSSQHLLAGSSTQNELYIFDVHRGVHSHTIDITLGDFRSVAISKSNDNEIYVLVHRKGKLLALHYDLEHKTVKGGAVNKATLKKKIKLGSCDEEDVHSLSLALIEAKGSFLAVRVGKKIKVVNVQDGKTSFKLKIKSTSDSTDDDGDSMGDNKSIATSGTNMTVSNDGSLLTVATGTGLYFFSTTSQSNIGTCAHLPNIQQVFIHTLPTHNKSNKSKAKAPQKHIVLANCSSHNGESSSHLFHVQEQQSKKVNSKAFAAITPPSNKSDTTISIIQSFFSKHDLIMAELAKVGFQNVNVQMNRLSYHNDNDNDGNDNNEVTFRRGNLYPVDDENEKDQGQLGKGSSSSSSKKRKTNIVLGPGETGGESLTVTDGIKRARTRTAHNASDDDDKDNDNDDEMDFELEPEDDDDEDSNKEGGTTTIAQRLALLSSELERGDSYSEDEGDDDHWRNMVGSGGSSTGAASGGLSSSSTKFAARHATSDSLLILLRQALQSNDDAQLEVALQVSDKRVIENSIMALQRESMSMSMADENNDDGDGDGDSNSDRDGELMIMLLTKLVTRISRKPARAPQLQFWIRTVLVALLSSTSSSGDGLKMGKVQKDVAARLAPLRSMLSERVESLPALLRLEGRLSLIGRVE